MSGCSESSESRVVLSFACVQMHKGQKLGNSGGQPQPALMVDSCRGGAVRSTAMTEARRWAKTYVPLLCCVGCHLHTCGMSLPAFAGGGIATCWFQSVSVVPVTAAWSRNQALTVRSFRGGGAQHCYDGGEAADEDWCCLASPFICRHVACQASAVVPGSVRYMLLPKRKCGVTRRPPFS
jgi:hypothetical protein